jgi:DNA-binding helix-hairpin-helix protein with protein kinase domain
MNVLTSNNIQLSLANTPLSKGGEGSVYKILTRGKEKYCAKIYHPDKRTQLRLQKLTFMVRNRPQELITESFIICWPVDIIYSLQHEFIGFIMPLAFSSSTLLYQLCRPTLNRDLSSEWA